MKSLKILLISIALIFSFGVKQLMEVTNPALIKVRVDKLTIMDKAMDSE